MTLRARLTLFFVAIVVVPLLVAGFLVRAAISREVDRRTDIKLRGDERAMSAAWQVAALAASTRTRQAAQDLAAALRRGDGPSDPAFPATIGTIRAAQGLDYLVVRFGGGAVYGSLSEPQFLPGAPGLTTATVVDPGGLASLLIPAEVPIQRNGADVATVLGGTYLDQPEVRELSRVAGGANGEVVLGGRPLASTITPAMAITPSPPGRAFEVGKDMRARTTLIGTEPAAGASTGGASAAEAAALVVVANLQGDIAALQDAILIVLFGAVVVATLLGFGMARVVAEPLRRLADQASAVLAGSAELTGGRDLELTELPADEVQTVATTLAAISEHLHHYATELSNSRDELRRNLERLGSTLRSTHELHGMLSAALDAAAVSLGAQAGAVYLLDPAAGNLFTEVSRGIEPATFRMRLGEGIAGTAAQGRTVLVPSGNAPSRAPGEPNMGTAMAVPLVAGDRLVGVIGLYGRKTEDSFSADDVASLAAFARETGVAVENVKLHEQAERLSMTDALTGMGNRRSMDVSLPREVERARRYDRALSVLMVDIDRFKHVNDELGHLRGDQVLAEVARRLQRSVRHGVDAIVRYGGEEFVVVLPETDRAGARAAGERVRQQVAGNAFGITDDGANLAITVSVGFATYPEDGAGPDELVSSADRAMYAAKAMGGDAVASVGSDVRSA